jgi:large subunit ribosomal protein L21
VEFACTRGPVLGPSAFVAESADAESSKHGQSAVPTIASVCDGMRFDGGIGMYAVIRAGGKQYRVAPGDVVRLETQADTDGKVEFSDVLAVSGGDGQIGLPKSGAHVSGRVVEQGRAKKILVFHYKRKKQYKKLRGHRQAFTAVRITEIAFDGQSFKAPEPPKKEPKVKKAAPVEVEHVEHKAEHKAKAHAPAKKKAVTKKAVPKKAAPKKKK